MNMLGDYRRDHGHYAEAYDWYQKAAGVGDAFDKGRALDALGKMYLDGYLGEEKEVTAVRYFEKASELGYASGTLHLAQCYDNGWGVAEDVERAFTYYLKTVEDAGDINKSAKGEALNRLGVMYLNGDLGENGDATAAQYFAQAADVGDAWGAANLAECYGVGLGVAQDAAKAFAYYQMAAEAGNEKGMKGIAGCYAEGKGVAQDDKKALFWYRKAAEAGDTSAMLLAGDYLRDNGHAAEARDWYEKAAEEGDEDTKGWAFNRLGIMYSDGLLGRDGTEKAIRYFEKSAEFGCAAGMYNLAYHYEDGVGVAEDKIRAASYYKRAAEAGDDYWKGEALNSLGSMYRDGDFGKKGDPRCVEYFEKAAKLGCVSGVANLAICYEFGSGVPENKTRAIRLYQQAAQAGDEFARERLEELKKDDTPVVKKNNSSMVEGTLDFFS